MEPTIFEKFAAKKQEQEQEQQQEETFSKKFEQLVDKLLQTLDINIFERIISRIYVDQYMMSVSGITYKLDNKSRELVKRLVSMFSTTNVKHPMDYSKNKDVLAFMEDVRGKSVPSTVVFNARMPGSLKFTEFLKKYNDIIQDNDSSDYYDYLYKMFNDI